MKQINIPSSVTTIKSSAFSECSSLIKIIIPPSVTSIGSNVFNGCNINEIECDPNKTALTNLINDKSKLTKLIISPTVKALNNFDLNQYSNIKEIIIPLSVISIGDSLLTIALI